VNKDFELELCVDCTHVLANGVESEEHARAADAMTSKWGPGWLLLLNHPEGGDVAYFSWKDCDGCGSRLGGMRFTAIAEKLTQLPGKPVGLDTELARHLNRNATR
jgi:hypothetical protein